MEIKNIDDCFKFRLLRKITPDKEKSKKSVELARQRIEDAKVMLKVTGKLKFFNHTIMDAYMAMFHASRALLYKDGIQEKSHFAVYIYLKDKYSDRIPIPIINLLNLYRIERHEAIYGLEFNPTREEAEKAIEDAEIFVKEIIKVLLS